MISEKMIKMTQGGSAIRAMFEEGNRLRKLYGDENVYDFTLGNPNFPAPEKVRTAAEDILRNCSSVDVHGYMSNSGYPEVRSAVAENLNSRFGTDFTGDNILMTVGAAGAMNVILKTLLNPGDEVLVFAPFFLEYGNYISNYDGVMKIIPANIDGDFQPSPEALAEAVTPRTKAVIINNPNNPTGVIYSAQTVTALAAVLERKQKELGTSIYLISDEPYRELAYDGYEVPFLTKYYRNTVVGYSWSKSLSLPGERIGYLAVNPAADDAELIMNAATIANRILGFVNAPSLMQRVVAQCLDEKADVDAYDANRRSLYKGLTDCGFECVYPSGAFYMWMKAPGGDDKLLVERAKKYNVLLVGGASFACPGYVRIAYCVSPDTIKNSLPAFKKLAEEYGI